jgi:prepilin-type N-terminal cleavage/methylation domain-containing protein
VRKGFTIIELLVVVAIIGILTGAVMIAVSDSRQKARDARRKTELRSIENAIELYASYNNGKFPASLKDLHDYLTTQTGSDYKLPEDPLNGQNNCTDGTNNNVTCAYAISNTLCQTGSSGNGVYSLTARLERKGDTALTICSNGGRTGSYYVVEGQ